MGERIHEINQTAGSILARRAFLEPDKEAIIFEGRRLTYKQLNERANSTANAVLRLGIKRGDRVAILMSNSNEYLEILFGAAKIGATAVLVNTRLIAREIIFILNDSEAKVLFYGTEFADLVQQIHPNVPGIQKYIEVGGKTEDIHYEQLIMGEVTAEPIVDLHFEDNLMIIYTSGTTGRPKGVLITHKNSLYGTMNAVISTKVTAWKPLVMGPLFHVASINANSIPCILVGGTQVILPTFDPELALWTIEKEKCTFTTGVPLFAERMLKIQKEKKYDISSLEAIIIGGASVPGPLVRAWLEHGVRLVEIYGMTEVTTYATFFDDLRTIQEKEGSAGKPAFFTNLRIVNEQHGDVRRGEVGEIIVKGPNVIEAYWNRPEENRGSFREGWLHTGDLGRLDEEGFLYVVDRKKDMIKTGGENVYPAELELVILEHPAIEAVALVGIPDPKWGEAVSAAVVLRNDFKLSEDEFIDYCKANMARYRVPKSVKFVEELPRSSTGKVLKSEVKKLFI